MSSNNRKESKNQKLNPKKLPKPSLFFATIIQKSKVSVSTRWPLKKDPNCLLSFDLSELIYIKLKNLENSKKMKKFQSDGSNFKSEVMFETKITKSS